MVSRVSVNSLEVKDLPGYGAKMEGGLSIKKIVFAHYNCFDDHFCIKKFSRKAPLDPNFSYRNLSDWNQWDFAETNGLASSSIVIRYLLGGGI